VELTLTGRVGGITKEHFMKVIVTAIAAAALLIGAGAAQAQNSMSAGADMKADSSMSTPRHSARHHRTYRRHTTGIGSENNASARGSLLPGKDKLNSKAYLQNH
jgi:hypothetical protein